MKNKTHALSLLIGIILTSSILSQTKVKLNLVDTERIGKPLNYVQLNLKDSIFYWNKLPDSSIYLEKGVHNLIIGGRYYIHQEEKIIINNNKPIVLTIDIKSSTQKNAIESTPKTLAPFELTGIWRLIKTKNNNGITKTKKLDCFWEISNNYKHGITELDIYHDNILFDQTNYLEALWDNRIIWHNSYKNYFYTDLPPSKWALKKRLRLAKRKRLRKSKSFKQHLKSLKETKHKDNLNHVITSEGDRLIIKGKNTTFYFTKAKNQLSKAYNETCDSTIEITQLNVNEIEHPFQLNFINSKPKNETDLIVAQLLNKHTTSDQKKKLVLRLGKINTPEAYNLLYLSCIMLNYSFDDNYFSRLRSSISYHGGYDVINEYYLTKKMNRKDFSSDLDYHNKIIELASLKSIKCNYCITK